MTPIILPLECLGAIVLALVIIRTWIYFEDKKEKNTSTSGGKGNQD